MTTWGLLAHQCHLTQRLCILRCLWEQRGSTRRRSHAAPPHYPIGHTERTLHAHTTCHFYVCMCTNMELLFLRSPSPTMLQQAAPLPTLRATLFVLSTPGLQKDCKIALFVNTPRTISKTGWCHLIMGTWSHCIWRRCYGGDLTPFAWQNTNWQAPIRLPRSSCSAMLAGSNYAPLTLKFGSQRWFPEGTPKKRQDNQGQGRACPGRRQGVKRWINMVHPNQCTLLVLRTSRSVSPSGQLRSFQPISTSASHFGFKATRHRWTRTELYRWRSSSLTSGLFFLAHFWPILSKIDGFGISVPTCSYSW